MKNKLKRKIGRKKFNKWLKTYKPIIWLGIGIPIGTSPKIHRPKYNKSWDTFKE